MTKQEIVDFLFWFQHAGNGNLVKQWAEAKTSNRYVAQLYIDNMITEGRLEE